MTSRSSKDQTAPSRGPRPRQETLLPRVAEASGSNPGLVATLAAAAALGVVAFMWLSNGRHAPDQAADAQSLAAKTDLAPPATSIPPPELIEIEAQARAPVPPPPPEPPVSPSRAPAPIFLPLPPAAGTFFDVSGGKRSAPALVVDLGEQGAAPKTNAVGGSPGTGGRAGSADEDFASRISGEGERVRATRIRNRGLTVAQGTIMPAVLETALNSDLPGMTRAVVSKDVRSFDSSRVLIPRGSRLIGQYRSGLSLGASRAFVIWTRVIRPDGVSVQIGSPATDPLGRAGLAGAVDRHFLERFGGSILLSVVNAGVNSLPRRSGTQVVIGSSMDAGALASSASSAASSGQSISPTVNVPQGTPIQVFVAKDLDFSAVEDAP